MEQKKILVVDDEADMLPLYQKIFRNEIKEGSFQFLQAKNGKEALEILEEHAEIDLVFLDIKMPQMDGLQLLGEIFQRPGLRERLRIIMVSAYGSTKNVRQARELGAFTFLVKPFDIAELRETVHKL